MSGWPCWAFAAWKNLLAVSTFSFACRGYRATEKLDLTRLISNDHIPADKPQTCQVERNPPFDQGLLAEQLLAAITPAIEGKTGVRGVTG